MLVAGHVAGHQHQADDETVVANDVVGCAPGAAEHQQQVGAVAAVQGHRVDVEHAIEVGRQGRAACRGGDYFVAQVAIETRVQAQPGGDQVIDAQAARGPFRQGDHDVVGDAFADHQVAARGVRGAGVIFAEGAVLVGLADGRGGNLLAGELDQVGRCEVLAAVDAGVVGQCRSALQGTGGEDGIGHGHVIGDDHHVAAGKVGGGAGAAGQQGGLTVGVEERDGVAVDAVVGALHQQGAVTAVDLQVGRTQAAACKRQPCGQRDAGADVVSAAAAAVLQGSGQPKGVSAIDTAHIAVHRCQAGDAAAERHATGAGGRPAAGGAGDCAVTAGDHAVLDVQHRFGDRRDHRHIRRREHSLVDGGGLARLRQHVQCTLVGIGLIAHDHGETHLHRAAV
ncbi:hypothetical protein D3C78_289320 [compost metagenome]